MTELVRVQPTPHHSTCPLPSSGSLSLHQDPQQDAALRHLARLHGELLAYTPPPLPPPPAVSQASTWRGPQFDAYGTPIAGGTMFTGVANDRAAAAGLWGRFGAIFGGGGGGGGGSSSSASGSDLSVVDAPLGVYLHGGPGCGKSLMMDTFFDSCHFVERRRRLHFNEFMLDVHRRMHELRQVGGVGVCVLRERCSASLCSLALRRSVPQLDGCATRNGISAPISTCEQAHPESGDPLPLVAHNIAESTQLLCFDEFQVTDVADALVMRRLFHLLFGYGLVMVATSNRAPAELYKNGIQRDSFVPFISDLTLRCEVPHDSPTRLSHTTRAISSPTPLTLRFPIASHSTFAISLTLHRSPARTFWASL